MPPKRPRLSTTPDVSGKDFFLYHTGLKQHLGFTPSHERDHAAKLHLVNVARDRWLELERQTEAARIAYVEAQREDMYSGQYEGPMPLSDRFGDVKGIYAAQAFEEYTALASDSAEAYAFFGDLRREKGRADESFKVLKEGQIGWEDGYHPFTVVDLEETADEIQRRNPLARTHQELNQELEREEQEYGELEI